MRTNRPVSYLVASLPKNENGGVPRTENRKATSPHASRTELPTGWQSFWLAKPARSWRTQDRSTPQASTGDFQSPKGRGRAIYKQRRRAAATASGPNLRSKTRRLDRLVGLFRHGPRTTLCSNQHSLAALRSKLSTKQGREGLASNADRFAPLSLTAPAVEISSVLSASKRVAGEVGFGGRLRGLCVFRRQDGA